MKRFKVKVVPYGSYSRISGQNYVIQYSNSYGLWWSVLRQACGDDLIPLFYNNFERACEVAKELTLEGIREYQKNQKIIYQERIDEYRERESRANKTFTIP